MKTEVMKFKSLEEMQTGCESVALTAEKLAKEFNEPVSVRVTIDVKPKNKPTPVRRDELMYAFLNITTTLTTNEKWSPMEKMMWEQCKELSDRMIRGGLR